MKDFYHNLQVKQLYAITDTSADAYTYYLDTTGLDAVGFLVVATMTTADGSNYVTPKVYGYTGATPGTFTNYTALTDDEVNGSDSATYAYLNAMDSTTSFTSFLSLTQHNYKYYCLFLDETLTAQGQIGVYAIVSTETQPASSATLTTGAVT